MYQKKENFSSQDFVECPHCGHETNDPDATNCSMCGGSLTVIPEETKLKIVDKKFSKNIRGKRGKKKNILAIGCLVLVTAIGLNMVYRYVSGVISEQKEEKALEKLSSNSPQLEGLMRVWSPPGTKIYLTKLVGKALNNDGRFNILPINIGSRDPIEELKQNTVSFVLIDNILFSRQIKKAREMGYKVVAVPIGMDAIAYAVNEGKTGVNFLTNSQIESIYRGEIINWKEVGGNDLPIKVILLSKRNSLNVQFNNRLAKNTKFLKNSELVISALKEYDGGFAYISPSQAEKKGIKVLSIKRRDGKIVSPVIEVDGKLQPNLKAFANGDYPDLKTITLAYLDMGLTHERVMSEGVRDFILSKEGQELLRRTGHIPLYIPLVPKSY